MHLRRVSVIVVIILVLGVVGCAKNQLTTTQVFSGDKMAEANQLYEKGNFVQAAQIYHSLIRAGVKDDAVYYNLGNAYFKQGDLGRAILNYKHAQSLSPRDPDIEDNLQLARAQTQDRLDREGNGIAGFVTYVLVGWSTFDEVAGAALVLWILLCGLAVLVLMWHRLRRPLGWVMMIMMVGLIMCILSLGIRVVDAQRSHGVIVIPSIEVHSGPGTDYLVEFTLHSGTEIRVLEHRNSWSRIALPGDLQGWVPDEVVEEL